LRAEHARHGASAPVHGIAVAPPILAAMPAHCIPLTASTPVVAVQCAGKTKKPELI